MTASDVPPLPESAAHPPESAAHPPESAEQPPESVASPPESPAHTPESAAQRPESVEQLLESAATPPESVATPPESAEQPPESLEQPPVAASQPPTATPEHTTHGVGPWPGGPEAWPTDPEFNPELLAHGDTRNVIDRYRYWRMDAVVADLDTRRHPFHVAIENWQHDMNIGSIVRSANAFLADTVHIIGRRRWNKRGAMVTDRYQHVVHHEDVAAFAAWAASEALPVMAVDNVDGSVPVDRADLPERCVLLFGQEGPGLSAEALAAASGIIEITQYGSTRSINASAAAAVVMYEWCRRHAG